MIYSKVYEPLTEREEYLGREIVDAAYKVHKKLGPGLLERVYEACFCHELAKKGIKFIRQADLEIYYDNACSMTRSELMSLLKNW